MKKNFEFEIDGKELQCTKDLSERIPDIGIHLPEYLLYEYPDIKMLVRTMKKGQFFKISFDFCVSEPCNILIKHFFRMPCIVNNTGVGLRMLSRSGDELPLEENTGFAFTGKTLSFNVAPLKDESYRLELIVVGLKRPGLFKEISIEPVSMNHFI